MNFLELSLCLIIRMRKFVFSDREGEESRGPDTIAHGGDQGPDRGCGSDGSRHARAYLGSDGPGGVGDSPVRVEEPEGIAEGGGGRNCKERRRGEWSVGELEGF